VIRALGEELERLHREGREGLAVVATAGCTAVGAFCNCEGDAGLLSLALRIPRNARLVCVRDLSRARFRALDAPAFSESPRAAPSGTESRLWRFVR
jgi:hypothetical protein